MTGVFVVEINKGENKRIRMVEEAMEIFQNLLDWWETANSGDKFIIECDLPV